MYTHARTHTHINSFSTLTLQSLGFCSSLLPIPNPYNEPFVHSDLVESA